MAIFIYRQPLINKLYKAVLRELLVAVKSSNEYQYMGVFRRDDGSEVTLLDGLREDIKPNWKSMVNPAQRISLPSEKMLAGKVKKCRDNVNDLELMLKAHGISLHRKLILEIGCYDGIQAYQLSTVTSEAVLASDMSEYYIVQRQGEKLNIDSLEAQNTNLNKLRQHCLDFFNSKTDVIADVNFVEDDITTSTLPDACVDVICSWEVLEHLSDPVKAFENMYRLLKPGGICYHEYNSFFSIDGGHSLCTLDFHWGHARLHNVEFDRYVDDLRPKENEIDKNFFYKSLNRMTLSLLKKYAESAGFTVKTIIPWVNEFHIELVDGVILDQVREVYPTAEMLDLVSPKVCVVIQKN